MVKGVINLSEFRGEMKTLVQTYVELLYPDDLEMQDALLKTLHRQSLRYG